MSFRGVFIAGLTALTAIGGFATIGPSTARAASAITLPGDLAFPESLAASSDGTLYHRQREDGWCSARSARLVDAESVDQANHLWHALHLRSVGG